MKLSITTTLAACSAVFASLGAAHNSFITPCPRYSTVGIDCPKLPTGQKMDGTMNAPISSIQQGYSKPLCKHTVPWPTPAAKWTAGQSVTIKFNPHAVSHSGGHCEFSVSYDGGKTFAVIHRELRYCFVGSKPAGLTNTVKVNSYTFDLPKDLPSSDKAIFAWSWVNASGNREFYMNCADVAIKGTSKSFTGPKMVIANYKGYPTIPEFDGNYETGMKHYTGAKNITITGDGSSSGGGGGGYTTSDAPASSAPIKTSSTSDYATSAPAAPTHTTRAPNAGSYVTSDVPPPVGHDAPSTTSAQETSAAVPPPTRGDKADESEGCTAGLIRCQGDGYQVCVRGKWSESYQCGVGTVCKGADGHVYCGWK